MLSVENNANCRCLLLTTNLWPSILSFLFI